MPNSKHVESFDEKTAKAILIDVLTALKKPENVQKISEAKEGSGNEMLKMMQLVFPFVTQIQTEVIKNYGFPEGRDGIIDFVQCMRKLEPEDPEITEMYNEVKSYFLPPVASNPSPPE